MLEGFSGLLSLYTQKLNRINVSSICGCCNSQILQIISIFAWETIIKKRLLTWADIVLEIWRY